VVGKNPKQREETEPGDDPRGESGRKATQRRPQNGGKVEARDQRKRERTALKIGGSTMSGGTTGGLDRKGERHCPHLPNVEKWELIMEILGKDSTL